MIILDEIQHLSMGRSGGANKVLNFIVTLINTVGVPVILVGTPKSIPFLQGEFRQARRSEGVGGIVWNRMEKDENFKLLLEGLWDYQWIRKPTPLNGEFIDVMFTESMGITDICIKLFIMAQIRAISSGKEEITVKLIKKVAEENLKFVRPMLNDIRSGNINKMAKYSDIVELNIEGFLSDEINKININDKIKEIKELKKQDNKNFFEKIREEAILKIIDLDIDEKSAVNNVDEYLKGQKEETKVSNIVKGVLKKLSNGSSHNDRKNISKQYEEDLRRVVNAEKMNGISVYRALKNEGYIIEIEKILRREEV